MSEADVRAISAAEGKEARRGMIQVYTGNGKGKTTAAIGMAVAAKGMQSPDMRRMAKKAARRMDHMKDDLADTLGF